MGSFCIGGAERENGFVLLQPDGGKGMGLICMGQEDGVKRVCFAAGGGGKPGMGFDLWRREGRGVGSFCNRAR